MPKVDPFGGVRPARAVYKREYTDDEKPGETITLWLRRADPIDQGKIGDLANRKIEEFITGDETEGTPPRPFPAVGGEWIEVSKSLCAVSAAVCVMQHPEDKAERYTFDEILAIAAGFPNAWKRIQKDARNLNARGNPDADPPLDPPSSDEGKKGGLTTPIGALSGSSSTESNSTPSTSPELTPS